MEINYDKSRLLAAVDRFPEVTVLVVGDVMLDEFVWGAVRRISPEAPVPVVEVKRETRLLGGAANVINNIVSAGGRARLAGVVGRDRHGKRVAEMLEELGVQSDGLIKDSNRPTTLKTRVVAHAQQVVRIDREKKSPLSRNSAARIVSFLESAAANTDGVIISDYGKGVVTETVLDAVRAVYGRAGKFIAVDPKVSNFSLYREVSAITPNHLEAALGAGLEIDSEESLIRAGRRIMTDLNCGSVLITRGEAGMTLFEGEQPPTNIPTVARKVFDVTGAGDTVIAVLTLGRAAGLSLREAAILANFAAGVVVGEVGTSAITAEKLKAGLNDRGKLAGGRKGR